MEELDAHRWVYMVFLYQILNKGWCCLHNNGQGSHLKLWHKGLLRQKAEDQSGGFASETEKWSS